MPPPSWHPPSTKSAAHLASSASSPAHPNQAANDASADTTAAGCSSTDVQPEVQRPPTPLGSKVNQEVIGWAVLSLHTLGWAAMTAIGPLASSVARRPPPQATATQSQPSSDNQIDMNVSDKAFSAQPSVSIAPPVVSTQTQVDLPPSSSQPVEPSANTNSSEPPSSKASFAPPTITDRLTPSRALMAVWSSAVSSVSSATSSWLPRSNATASPPPPVPSVPEAVSTPIVAEQAPKKPIPNPIKSTPPPLGLSGLSRKASKSRRPIPAHIMSPALERSVGDVSESAQCPASPVPGSFPSWSSPVDSRRLSTLSTCSVLSLTPSAIPAAAAPAAVPGPVAEPSNTKPNPPQPQPRTRSTSIVVMASPPASSNSSSSSQPGSRRGSTKSATGISSSASPTSPQSPEPGSTSPGLRRRDNIVVVKPKRPLPATPESVLAGTTHESTGTKSVAGMVKLFDTLALSPPIAPAVAQEPLSPVAMSHSANRPKMEVDEQSEDKVLVRKQESMARLEKMTSRHRLSNPGSPTDDSGVDSMKSDKPVNSPGRDSGVSDSTVEELTSAAATAAAAITTAAIMERDSAVLTSPRSKPQPPAVPAIPSDLVPLPRMSSGTSPRPPPISVPPTVALPKPLPPTKPPASTLSPSTCVSPLHVPELIPRAGSVPPPTSTFSSGRGDQSPSSSSAPLLPTTSSPARPLQPKPMRQTKSTLTLYSHRSPSMASGSLTSWADVQSGKPGVDTPLLSPSLYVDPVAVAAMMQDEHEQQQQQNEATKSPVVYTLAEAKAEGLVRSLPAAQAHASHLLPDAVSIGHRLSMDSLLAGAAEGYGRIRKGSDWSSSATSTPEGSEPSTEAEADAVDVDPEHKQKMREDKRRRRVAAAAAAGEDGGEEVEETEEERANRRAEKKAKKRAKKLAKLQEQVEEARKRKRRTMTIALNGGVGEDEEGGDEEEDETERMQLADRARTGTGLRPPRPKPLTLTGLRGSVGSVSSTDSITTGTTGSLASPPANGQVRSSRPSSHGYGARLSGNGMLHRRPSSGLMNMLSPASSPTTNASSSAHAHDYRRDSDLSSIGDMYARCSASSSAYGFLVHELGADERSPHLFLEGQLARFPSLPRHLFTDWTHLTMLDLSGNGLTELPPSVALLYNLHTLIMRENRLTDFLPEDFGGLEKLVKLDVAVNRLVDLDWTQCVSPRLEYLDVRTNQLTALSPYLCQLSSLKILLVDNNPLTASFAQLASPLQIHPCTNPDCPIFKHEMGQEEEVISDRMSVLSGRSSRLSIRSAMSETAGLSPTLPSRPGGTSRFSGDSGFAGSHGDAMSSSAASKNGSSVLNKDLPDLPALPSDIIDMIQDAEAALGDPVDMPPPSLAGTASVHSSASSAPYSAVIYSQSAIDLAAATPSPAVRAQGPAAPHRNASADFSSSLPASTITAAKALAARGRRSNTSPPNSASPAGGSSSRSASVAAHMMRTSTAAVTKQFVGMFKKRGKRSSSGMAVGSGGRRSLSSDDDFASAGGLHGGAGALTDYECEYLDDEDLCSSVVPGDGVNGHTHLGSIQTIEYVNGLGKLMRYLHDLYDLEPSTSEADEVLRQMRSMVSANRAANEAAGEASISSIRSSGTASDEGKRKHIVAEIVATEETYVQELKALYKIYIEPLHQLKYLSAKELHMVFGNVESILAFHGDTLLPQLKSEESQVGQVFLANAAYLKMYSMFVNGCDKGLSEFERWLSKRKKLRQFLARCRQDPDHRQLNLQAYLLLPVQRIPRYKLLLADLLKHTPESHPDYDALTQAFLEIELRAKEINERKREQENMEKLVAIGQRIRMRASTPKEDAIIQPHRRIIREGELTLVRIVRVGTAVGRPTRSSGSTGFGLGAAYGLAMSAYGATVSMPMSNGSSASGTGQSQPPVSPTSQAYAAAQQIASSAGAPTVGPVLMETPIHKEHHFFLFNDMLVICKRDRDGNGHQYDFVFRCNLHSRVVPASITPEGYLRVVDADSILYMTSTEPHLRAWMKDINERYSR